MGPCAKKKGKNQRPRKKTPQALGRKSFHLESRQRFLRRLADFLATFLAGFFLAVFLAALAFFLAFFAAGFLPLLAGAFFLAAGFGAGRGGCGAPAAPGRSVMTSSSSVSSSITSSGSPPSSSSSKCTNSFSSLWSSFS